mmetsp:Transcript_107785/g.300447  ORF Transcript_107785/g.300447 Transcript_107785/m.300447 type:complete len:323 (-) Transcript_107785:1964-2932(-)
MLLAEVRVGQVAHHDVPSAEADLTLLLLAGIEDVAGPGAGPPAGAGRGGLEPEDADLPARARETAAAPAMPLIGRERPVGGGLAHAIELVDLHPIAAECLQRLERDGRGARHAVLAGVEAQVCPDLGEDHRVGQAQAARRAAGAAVLQRPRGPERLARGPLRRGGLPHAADDRHPGPDAPQLLRPLPRSLQALVELLPDPRHAEEVRRAHEGQAVLERTLLEVVRPGAVDRRVALRAGGQGDGHGDVELEARYVREGQVREHALLAELHAELMTVDVEHRAGREAEAVVGEHHGLRHARGAGCVHEAARRSRRRATALRLWR